MSTYTPGPWHVVKGADRWGIFAPNGDKRPGDCYTSEADARLIAAAPGLLEALEGLLANTPKPKSIRKDFSYTLYLETARAAIAKAKGKA